MDHEDNLHRNLVPLSHRFRELLDEDLSDVDFQFMVELALIDHRHEMRSRGN
ncbi:hypothetical protein ACXVUM_17850 [Williamsia sp. SKLECPSW1]